MTFHVCFLLHHNAHHANCTEGPVCLSVSAQHSFRSDGYLSSPNQLQSHSLAEDHVHVEETPHFAAL